MLAYGVVYGTELDEYDPTDGAPEKPDCALFSKSCDMLTRSEPPYCDAENPLVASGADAGTEE